MNKSPMQDFNEKLAEVMQIEDPLTRWNKLREQFPDMFEVLRSLYRAEKRYVVKHLMPHMSTSEISKATGMPSPYVSQLKNDIKQG